MRDYDYDYDSPIQLIMGEIQSKIKEQEEQSLITYISSIGFNVDKDELMKALNYDRHQYEKGYSDAMKNAVPLDELCEWLEENHDYFSYFIMHRDDWKKVIRRDILKQEKLYNDD